MVFPTVRQRLGLALFSIGVGLIAGTGGLALIVADQDSDPRNVFAFTPLQTLAVGTAVPIPDPQVPPVKTVLAREVSDPNAITPEIAKRENAKPCRGFCRQGAYGLEPEANVFIQPGAASWRARGTMASTPR